MIDVEQEVIEINLQGGVEGKKGDPGPANTLSIGSVQQGEGAAASITGQSPNQTLNLTLPKGNKGDKGDSGVWTSNESPPEDYDVWVDPEGTPGTIPTKTSDLTNDSGFITSAVNDLTNYYTKSEIDILIGNIESLLEEI